MDTINYKKQINLISSKCPINVAKIKLSLEEFESGEILKVLTNKGESLKNISRSVKNEGHEIIHAELDGDNVSLWIKKK